MTIPAPRINTNLPADYWFHIADISSADVDLTAVSQGGKFAAQVVRFNNATTGALTAVIIPEQRSNGTTSQSMVINAGQQYEHRVPVKKIVASGSGALSADVFWWFGNSIEINR